METASGGIKCCSMRFRSIPELKKFMDFPPSHQAWPTTSLHVTLLWDIVAITKALPDGYLPGIASVFTAQRGREHQLL